VSAVVATLGAAVGLLAVLVIGLLRSHAEVLRRLHELGAGVYDDDLPLAAGGAGTRSPVALGPRPDIRTRPGVAGPSGERDAPGAAEAHDIAGVSPAGETVAVGIVGAPHLTLLAFLSSGCATCAGFWRAFADGVADDLPGPGTRLVIVTRGPESESPAEVRRLAPPAVTTVMSTVAFDRYDVPVNPYFLLVDGPRGRVIGEGAAATWAQVADLLRRAAADHGAVPATGSARRAGGGGVDRRRARVSELDSRQRDALAEAELLSAGIGPGHPSLYPDGFSDDGPTSEGGD
jgi:hypothetical protein